MGVNKQRKSDSDPYCYNVDLGQRHQEKDIMFKDISNSSEFSARLMSLPREQLIDVLQAGFFTMGESEGDEDRIVRVGDTPSQEWMDGYPKDSSCACGTIMNGAHYPTFSYDDGAEESERMCPDCAVALVEFDQFFGLTLDAILILMHHMEKK